jgi:hypothetical protein
MNNLLAILIRESLGDSIVTLKAGVSVLHAQARTQVSRLRCGGPNCGQYDRSEYLHGPDIIGYFRRPAKQF